MIKEDEKRAFDQARMELAMKGAAGARSFIEEQLKIYPDCEQLHALKALNLMWTGDLESAEKYMNARLNVKRSASMLGFQAEYEIYMARYETAEKVLAEAERMDATDYFFFRSAVSMATLVGDYDTSLDLASRCLKVYPEDIETFGAIITAHQSAERYDVVEEILSNCPDWYRNSPSYHLKRGLVALKRLNVPSAESEFQQAVAMAPDSATGWAYLGMAQLHLKKFQESETSSQYALELNPRSMIALRNMSRIEKRKGNSNTANDYEKRAKEAIPAIKDINFASQATDFLQQGKPEEAIKIYRTYTQSKLHGARKVAQKLLVSVLIDQERWSEARQELDILLQTHVDVPAVRVFQLHVEYFEGKTVEALAALDRELDLPEPCVEVYPVAIKLSALSNEPHRIDRVVQMIKDKLPGFSPILSKVVMQLDIAKRHQEAREILSLAIRRYPNDSTLRILEFGIAVSSADKETALNLFRALPLEARMQLTSGKASRKPKPWIQFFVGLLTGKKKK